MKKIAITLMFLSAAQFAAAAEEECPSAVDAAEAQNHNLYKNCDYSEKGLNGVLHRALTKNKSTLGDENDTSPNEERPATEKSKKVRDNVEATQTNEFTSAAQLPLVKYHALQKVTQECTKGFVVEGERYLPIANNAWKLELIYHCL